MSTLSGDDYGHLVYLVLLGTLVGAGIFSMRGSFGPAMKSLGLWALIFVGISAVWTYQDDLLRIGSTVTGGLIPGRPVDNGDGTIALIRDGTGHFSARGEIDGEPVAFLVDTGASSIVLTYDDAERLGLRPDTLAFNTITRTANGEGRAARLRLDDVSVGSIRRQRIEALIAEPGALDGNLLGMSFLSTLSSFSFSGNRLTMVD